MVEGRSQKAPRRLQLACEPCKVGKLKCDRSLPICEQCYKRSRDSTCKYTEKGLRYNASVQSSSSIKEKIERLEALVVSLKHQESESEQVVFVDTAEPRYSQRDQRELPSQMGRLKFEESGSTQWIGPSHWEPIVDDLADVRACFEEEESQRMQMSGTSGMSSNTGVIHADLYFSAGQRLTQADLFDRMPPRSEMDRYVAAWFNVMDPTRIIVHAPTFQQQYEAFWLNPESVEPAWFALLLATGGLGAEISGQTLRNNEILAKADYLRQLTSHVLVLTEPTIPQRWLVECLISHITGLLYHQHDATSHIWQLIGLAIRLCHQAGYHRDPSHDVRLSPFVCEMRRRVWMVACELDISISNTLGMVSSVNYDICDTQPPSNLTEADLSHESCGAPRPYEECTLVQVEVCLAGLVRILGEVVVLTHAMGTVDKNEIDVLNERLAQARDQLPERLKMKSLNRSFIDSPTEVVDRLRLEFAYQKAQCLLYRRFLDRPEFDKERQKCIDAAASIVQHSVAMLLATQSGGQLAPLKVLLVRHIHDFILAGMLICSQLMSFSTKRSGVVEEFFLHRMRPKLLQACQLWDFPELRSAKARVALRAIMRFLNGEVLDGPRKNDLSDMSKPAPDTTFQAVALFDRCETPMTLEAPRNPHRTLPEKIDGASGAVLDRVSGSSGNLFEDMGAEWSWSAVIEQVHLSGMEAECLHEEAGDM